LLIATGFLRMGATDTATPALADRNAVRNQVVADTIKIVSTRCWDIRRPAHNATIIATIRFRQTDYYRLRRK